MKTKKINLIFFLPNFSEGGAGKSILKICNKINHKMFNITIISIGKCYYKNLFRKDISIVQLNIKKTFFAFFDIVKILKNFKRQHNFYL